MSSSPRTDPETGLDVEQHLWTVILAGGIGSRFWPASTPSRPKQLLPLAGSKPLIRDAVERILPLVPQERLRILTGHHLAEPIARALPELGPGNLLLEPRAAGTAPVLAWAAAEIERRDPDGVMISLHADSVIEPADAFRARLKQAAELAVRERRLFTVGARPDRPETGYGYIHTGEPIDEAGTAFLVDSFVEKPDRETAQRYLEDGSYLWNTGLFIWRVADLLDQLERFTPELAELVPILRAGGTEEFFRRTPSISIDNGLLERSDRVGVVAADFYWDDVGAWDAVYRTQPHDPDGNVSIGEAYSLDAKGCALYAGDGPLVAFGVEDLVIVRASGVTFVAHRDRVSELKDLLATLPDELRTLA